MPFTLPPELQSFLSSYKYKIELHAHTSPVSRCSAIPPDKLIENLAAKGYDAAVITNHFYADGAFMKTEDPVSTFLADFYKAKEAGERLGVRVLLGAEYRFTENSNDYLIFGVDEAFLRETVPALSMTYSQFYEEYRRESLFIVQAHPYRNGIIAAEGDHMDGVEAFNLHPGHNSRIAVTARWANENRIPRLTIGSDLHESGYEGLGATRTRILPETEAELVSLLRSGDYLMEIGGCPLLPHAMF